MKYIKFLSILALALLVAGCDMLPNPEKGIFENGQNISKVQVSVGGNARTILPGVGFSKIVLSAEPAEGNSNSAPPPVEAVSEYGWIQNPVINLPFGKWTISVTAYIDVYIELEDSYQAFPVAEGSIPFTVEDFYHSIVIPVYTPVPGGQGRFSYNVVFPTGADVSVKLDTWPIGQNPVYTNNNFNSNEYIDHYIESGIYFLTVKGEFNGKKVIRNEIVHIYQNAGSNAFNYNLMFDLSDFITVSGYATIIKNGNSVNEAKVIMRRSDNGYWLADTYVDLWDNGYWEMTLPVFDSETDVYFTVDFYDDKWNGSWDNPTGVTETLFNTNVSGIIINLEFSSIYLSGYAGILVNGDYPNWADIKILRADTDELLYYISTNWDFSWEVELPPFDAPTQLYFIIEGNDSQGNWFDRQYDDIFGATITAFENDISDIIILYDCILLTGNVAVTVDGSHQYLDYYWYAIDFGLSSGGSYDFGYTDIDTYTGEWAKLIPSSALNENIYLTLFVGADWCQFHQEEIPIYLNSNFIPNNNFAVDLTWQ